MEHYSAVIFLMTVMIGLSGVAYKLSLPNPILLIVPGMALLAHYLIPGMTWPLSYSLDSVLSSTDAVSAVSITKGLGLPQKTITILEGESLMNDASALVSFRYSLLDV